MMVDVNKLIQDAQTAKSQGNDSLAVQYLQQALSEYPNEISLLSACGNLCVKLMRYEEAADYFRRIYQLNKSLEVQNALCYALQALGNKAHNEANYHLAEASFEEVLQHQPNHAAYWYNLGNAQRELSKYTAAAVSFQKAIVNDPQFADAYNNLGNIQRELGQLDLAIKNYKKALSIDPNLHHALSHLIHQKQHICDWTGQNLDHLSAQIEQIRDWVRTKPEAKISPFAYLAMPNTTAEEQKLCATHYVTQSFSHLASARKTLAFSDTKKIFPKKMNIGYISADFRLHPLAFLITELIEQHDREKFRITAYSYGNDDKSAERKRLEKAFDSFIDIRQLNDIEAATKINQDQIDILIDLTGFTQSSRTGIVALKPANIHINWLGYPGTMGEFNHNKKPLFDYILADQIVASNKDHFSESIIYLPCYQPNTKREYNINSQKEAHNLPEDSIVFCCFNQTFKITPDIFDIWMRLLNQVPNSLLWLLDCNQWAKENLVKEAEKKGIQRDRLVFAPRVPSETHLERQRHADIFLDTLPYNAHTTASDVLWAGVPIITCKGNTFSARVAASLLNHIGLSELICESLDDYEIKALALANNAELLNQLKAKLQNVKTQSDLFNAEQFARRLESQFTSIWQSHCQDTSLL